MALQGRRLSQVLSARKTHDMIRVQSITYATDPPRVMTTGRRAKPSARFVVSRTSPMMVFIMPVVSLTGKPQHLISPPTCISVERSAQETTVVTFSQADGPLPYGSVHLIAKAVNVRESPKKSIDKALPIRPTRRTGLRPIWSDILQHCRTVTASATKNRDS